MTETSIGLLHPGAMGGGLGAALTRAGHTVCWASAGRSDATRRRAEAAGLVDVTSLENLVDKSDVVISICPPDAAIEVATSVAGFRGLYLDANAISPQTARTVASLIESGGGRYVDGGVIGAPPSSTNVAHLYLAGSAADEIAAIFSDPAVEVRVLAGDPVAASSLKMCFAAWTKGTSAMLLGVRALAVSNGVEAPLLEAWERTHPALAQASLKAGEQAATKGWRWVGEMLEIAATFRSAGLPDGFRQAAAEIYRRPDRDENASASPETLSWVLDALATPAP